MNVSCTLLNTVLKVKNRMVVWIDKSCVCMQNVVSTDPSDRLGNWDLGCCPASWEKIVPRHHQIRKGTTFKVQFLPNAYLWCGGKVEKLKIICWTAVKWGLPVLLVPQKFYPNSEWIRRKKVIFAFIQKHIDWLSIKCWDTGLKLSVGLDRYLFNYSDFFWIVMIESLKVEI